MVMPPTVTLLNDDCPPGALHIRTITLPVEQVGQTFAIRASRTREEVLAKRAILQRWLERATVADGWTIGPIEVIGPLIDPPLRNPPAMVGIKALALKDVPDHERTKARAYLESGAPKTVSAFQYREWSAS